MRRLLLTFLACLLAVPVWTTPTAIPGGTWIPRPMMVTNAAPAFTTIQINADTDRVALIARAPSTCLIDRAVIHVGTVTTAAALDVRIETVNTADANPSGTLWATNTSGTTGTPSSNTALEVTLTATASVTRGQVFAVVIQSNTTPIDLLVNSVAGATLGGGGGAFPYTANNLTGTYANISGQLAVGVRCSVGSVWQYLGGLGPTLALPANAFDDGTDTAATTGSRRGLYFQLPVPATLCGAWIKVIPSTQSANFSVELYDAGGSQIGADLATIDASQHAASFGSHGFYIDFDRNESLSALTNYRLVVSPTSTVNVTVSEFSVNDAAYMAAFEGGAAFHLTKFVSSAWVQVTTERPWMGLKLCQLDDGSASASTAGRFF